MLINLLTKQKYTACLRRICFAKKKCIDSANIISFYYFKPNLFIYLFFFLSSKMSDYQLCTMEEFLNDDDAFQSPDEFLQSLQPNVVEEQIQIPEEHIYQNAMLNKSEKMVEGEITQMLRIAPGILPPVDSFPKSYKPPKLADQPDFIPQGRHNKFPIFLDEKYFKFHDSDDESRDDDADVKSMNKNIRAMMNNLDGCGSGSNKNNGSRKSGGRSNESSRNRDSRSINDDSIRLSCDNEDFERRFRNVFINDSSDEDNCNVPCSPDSTSHENQVPQPTVTSPVQQQYYNARQLYEMKRGKKQ